MLQAGRPQVKLATPVVPVVTWPGECKEQPWGKTQQAGESAGVLLLKSLPFLHGYYHECVQNTQASFTHLWHGQQHGWLLVLSHKSEDFARSLLSTSRSGFQVRNDHCPGWVWFTEHHCPRQSIHCEMFTKALLGRDPCLLVAWRTCGWIRVSGRAPKQKQRSGNSLSLHGGGWCPRGWELGAKGLVLGGAALWREYGVLVAPSPPERRLLWRSKLASMWPQTSGFPCDLWLPVSPWDLWFLGSSRDLSLVHLPLAQDTTFHELLTRALLWTSKAVSGVNLFSSYVILPGYFVIETG